LILNGTIPGVGLNFNTLGIGNGIIDEYIQSAYYPEVRISMGVAPDGSSSQRKLS